MGLIHKLTEGDLVQKKVTSANVYLKSVKSKAIMFN